MRTGPVDDAPIRVLCVDVEPALASEAGERLERASDRIEAVTEPSASEGLARLADDRIDCVVADYDVPEMTGQAFLEVVREDYPELPFILFTGTSSEAVASGAISAGVTDYLRKEEGSDQYAVLATRIETAVSQRRQLERLEREHDRFQAAQELADVGAWEYDLEREVGWFSEGAYRIFGLPDSHEPTPEAGTEFFHPADRPTLTEAYENAAEAGEPYDLVARFETDGDLRWARVKGEPVFADGSVVGVRATVQDVTERTRRERRYETLVENLPGLVYRARLDADWPFETLHGEAEPMTGYTTDDLRETVSWGEEVLHPDDREWTYEAVQAAVEADEPFEIRYRIRPRDGDVRWMWERGRPVGGGVVEGFITDVTGLVESRRDVERYETIVEATGDGVYTLDPDGHFTYVNDALVDLIGRNRESLVGDHVSAVMDAADVDQGRAVIRSLLADGGDRHETFEMAVQTADGDEVPCENHVAVLDADGEFVGTVGVLRDISARERRERELRRQRDRLDEFASVVSHDLRNPLTVAKGYLQRARETGDADAFDEVDESLDRMERIVDDVLALAREGETIGETDPVPIAAVAAEAWRTVVPADAAADLVVADGLGTVEADPDRLSHLFENLFSNAVEHGSTSPRSEAPEDSADATRSPVTVRLEPTATGFAVEDDGPGIPDEIGERVFERGFTTGNDGTGLGLGIVADVADAHGWAVSLCSGTDGGARFEVDVDP